MEYLCRYAWSPEKFDPDTKPTRSMNFDQDLVMPDIPKRFLDKEESETQNSGAVYGVYYGVVYDAL